MNNTYRTIGELLVADGHLNSLQLSITLADQRVTSRKLGEIVVDRGFATENDVASCLAKQYHYSIANLDQVPDREILDKLTPEQSVSLQALPLRMSEQGLHIAIADPLDLASTDLLSHLFGGAVTFEIAPAGALREAIDNAYGLAPGVDVQIFPEASVIPQRFSNSSVIERFGPTIVFNAQDDDLARPVTLICSAEEEWDQGGFQQVVLAAAKGGTTGVVPVFDSFSASGKRWVILERETGESLHTVLRTRGPRPFNKAVEIVASIAETVNTLERNGVHAAWCSPRNVIVSCNGARLIPLSEPPRLGNSTESEGSANVLALGQLLHACLYGLDGSHQPMIPAALEEIVQRCTASDGRRRYKSAVQVAIALKSCNWTAKPANVSASSVEDRDRLLETMSVHSTPSQQGFWSRLFGRKAA